MLILSNDDVEELYDMLELRSLFSDQEEIELLANHNPGLHVLYVRIREAYADQQMEGGSHMD